MYTLSDIELAIARLRFGRMHCFRIDARSVSNGAKIDFILSKYGVRCYGVGCEYKSGKVTHYIFWTKAKQAPWAEHILSRLGIPIAQRYLSEANAKLYNEVFINNSRSAPPTKSKYFSVKTFSLRGLRWVGAMFGLFDAERHTPKLNEHSRRRRL